jgi:uncharacterized protein
VEGALRTAETVRARYFQPLPLANHINSGQILEITPSTIAAGTYRSLTKDYPTIGLYNFAVAHKDLPDGLVYQIVKTVFENQAELVKAHPVAKETVPENIERNTLFPLHPGALRYYREKGIAIPPPALEVTD